MDDAGFDLLARNLAQRLSRRGVAAGLASLLPTTLLVAEAKKRKKKKKKGKKKKTPVAPVTTLPPATCRRAERLCDTSNREPCCAGLTCDTSGHCRGCRSRGQHCGDGLGYGLDCCDGAFCEFGTCQDCRRLHADCDDEHPCCNGLYCDARGNCANCRTDDKSCADVPCCLGFICDETQTCRQCRKMHETCGEGVAAPCCDGLICDDTGHCESCRVARQACGPGNGDGLPCCDGYRCNEVGLCEHCFGLDQACGGRIEDCCDGLNCVDDTCQSCAVATQACGAAANGRECCDGFRCNELNICIPCGRSRETCIDRPCCEGFVCDPNSFHVCLACKERGEGCGLNAPCCDGMSCLRGVCTCQGDGQFCAPGQEPYCCPGLNCFENQCQDTCGIFDAICPPGVDCCVNPARPDGSCCTLPGFPQCCPNTRNIEGTIGSCSPAGSDCCAEYACPAGSYCCGAPDFCCPAARAIGVTASDPQPLFNLPAPGTASVPVSSARGARKPRTQRKHRGKRHRRDRRD